MNCGVTANDINVACLAYADDIVLLSSNEQGLQNMLHHLQRWSCKWKMEINSDKSYIIHFRGKKEMCMFI